MYKHVRTASIGMRSIEVVGSIFHNFRQHFRQMYTERNKNEMNEPLDFQKIVWFIFGKGEMKS